MLMPASLRPCFWPQASATRLSSGWLTNPNLSPLDADFTTPGYTTHSSFQAKKWESNRGLDPPSYPGLELFLATGSGSPNDCAGLRNKFVVTGGWG
jgi:hypothetical protein